MYVSSCSVRCRRGKVDVLIVHASQVRVIAVMAAGSGCDSPAKSSSNLGVRTLIQTAPAALPVVVRDSTRCDWGEQLTQADEPEVEEEQAFVRQARRSIAVADVEA